MRTPQRVKSRRGQVSQPIPFPAPVGGWNARDSLASMAPDDAIELKNYFPTTTDVELRGGIEAYGTGITGVVETLAVYNAMDGTSEMYAIDDNDIWDVTSSGAASAQSATVTNGRFQWINFGDGTNNYLILVNGVDSPIYYNGTTFTTITGATSPALSGVTLSSLVHVNEYKGRLFFIEEDSLSFWYLGAAAAGGALTEFDLSSFCKKGGYLMWMATWSFDSGDGPDDAAVFMTSEGEVLVYRGTNPSSASDWVLTGVYTIAKPIGRRSFFKYEGDLIVITQAGVYPMSVALQSNDKRAALTNKIEDAFNVAARSYNSNFGWEGIYFPLRSALIFNIPVQETGEHKQYVMNTITKSWCEFDSWNAECFVEYNNELYIGLNQVVYKAWTGYTDISSDIVGIGRTSFNYLNGSTSQKRVTMFRPVLRANGNIEYLTGMDVDFEETPITDLSSFTAISGGLWDSAVWDTSYWGTGLEVVKDWKSPGKNVGFCVSGALKTNTQGREIHWTSNDFVFESGGTL